MLYIQIVSVFLVPVDIWCFIENGLFGDVKKIHSSFLILASLSFTGQVVQFSSNSTPMWESIKKNKEKSRINIYLLNAKPMFYLSYHFHYVFQNMVPLNLYLQYI